MQPPDFDFGSAVCSHGFFVLAPNLWDPGGRILRTAIALDDDRAIEVAIRESGGRRLLIDSDTRLSRADAAIVLRAVRRILRLDEDLSPFHGLCRLSPSHRRAARTRFGRLLRSASLFEDIVKVICTCNVAWRATVTMAERIVRHWGVPTGDARGRGFPTPARLAAVSPAELSRKARVGYRAGYIHELACRVAGGLLDLDELEHWPGLADERYHRLRQIRGVGDYAASYLCILLGDYSRLAIDTETFRLLKERHPRRRFTAASIRACYRQWHPYQSLAYWYELWSDYVGRHGRSDLWSPADVGPRITSKRITLPGRKYNPVQGTRPPADI